MDGSKKMCRFAKFRIQFHSNNRYMKKRRERFSPSHCSSLLPRLFIGIVYIPFDLQYNLNCFAQITSLKICLVFAVTHAHIYYVSCLLSFSTAFNSSYFNTSYLLLFRKKYMYIGVDSYRVLNNITYVCAVYMYLHI